MEPAPRRSKREHQPSAKAAASSTSFPVASASPRTARRSQRRRVPPAASPSAASTPLRGTVTSHASSRLVSVALDAVGFHGQRRRLRAAAHTTTTLSVPHARVPSTYPMGVRDDRKVLGRYSSRDCMLLCEVILSQLEKQTLASTVLDEDKSPAFIRWEPVAEKMKTRHRLLMTPNECQLLWKFLAYGQENAVFHGGTEDERLLPDSDEELVYQSPTQVNARLAGARVRPIAEKMKQKQIAAARDGTTGQGQETQSAATEETAAKVDTDEVQTNKANESETREKQDTLNVQEKDEREPPAIRLYPTYSLPTGAPDTWYRSFGPKDALPLTFVASRFLRRKPTSLPAPSRAAATADLKRKQAEPANNTEAAKKSKLVTLPTSTPSCAYKPSPTPPLATAHARSELEFFELRLREEQEQKMPGATFDLSAADVQRRFGEASAETRRQCQTLAAYDVERHHREMLRVRTQQKATESGNTKSEPTLALASLPASKLAPSPPQASSAELMSAASAGNAAARLT